MTLDAASVRPFAGGVGDGMELDDVHSGPSTRGDGPESSPTLTVLSPPPSRTEGPVDASSSFVVEPESPPSLREGNVPGRSGGSVCVAPHATISSARTARRTTSG